MAQKRMFNRSITGSDAFREMPSSTQSLYFHLGMEADDDGFIDNYKSIQRAVGSSDDDFKILVAKRFVLVFPKGICVVKHWLINNTLRKDRYNPSKYLDEKNSLIIKENGAYTDGKKTGNHLATIGKVSGNPVELSRVKTSKDKISLNTTTDVVGVQDIFKLFYESINPTINFGNINQRKSAETLISKVGLEKAINATKFAISIQGTKYAPTITTPTQLLNKYGELQVYYAKNNNSNVITI